MRRLPALIAVTALAVPTFLAFGAAPAGAGTTSLVTVEGTAHCNVETGHETYTLNWTVTNGLVDDLNIDSSVESGAVTGPVDLTPEPIPAGATATGSDGPVSNMAGTVTLTVDWSYGGGEFPVTGSSVGQIVLDGNCTLPATTTVVPKTTTTVQAAALAVTPRFTG